MYMRTYTVAPLSSDGFGIQEFTPWMYGEGRQGRPWTPLGVGLKMASVSFWKGKEGEKGEKKEGKTAKKGK